MASATPDDASALSKLESRVWGITDSKYCFWTWVIAIRNQVVLKAVENGRIVGGAMISRRANHDGYYLDLIIVDPDHRNLGIGNALMKAALAAADGSEVAALVSTDNAASLSLLERFGFGVTREEGAVFGGPLNYLEVSRIVSDTITTKTTPLMPSPFRRNHEDGPLEMAEVLKRDGDLPLARSGAVRQQGGDVRPGRGGRYRGLMPSTRARCPSARSRGNERAR